MNYDPVILCGDVNEQIHKVLVPINCCITSPPYWGLRDYGVKGQLGQESKVSEYIANLVFVFKKIREHMSEDATLWLNIGDCYVTGAPGNKSVANWLSKDYSKSRERSLTVSLKAAQESYKRRDYEGLPMKNLIGIPWRLAFALQDDGWILRCDVVWHKTSCRPDMGKGRPPRVHEYVFLFSKSQKYFCDAEAIKEIGKSGELKRKDSIWACSSSCYKGAHFATFSNKLIRPAILAGCPKNGVVLDPFFGSGTVGEECKKLQRHCYGIELNPEYVELAKKRLKESKTN